MDPLSITAGVVGLLATAAAVIKALDTMRSSIQDTPRTITWALAEVTDVRSAISRLYDLIEHMDLVPSGAKSMIGVQDAVVSVSEMVVSFDSLLGLLGPFNVDGAPSVDNIWDKARWLRKKDDVARSIQQIQTHKGSITLILNILQWFVVFAQV